MVNRLFDELAALPAVEAIALGLILRYAKLSKLVNTAIAVAGNPVAMARAFADAVRCGREAYLAGLAQTGSVMQAEASSPLTAFLD